MTHLSEQLIIECLKSIKFPGYSRDIVSFGLVKDIKIAGNDVLVRLSLATNNPEVPATLQREIEEVLKKIPEIGTSKVQLDIANPPGLSGGGRAGQAGQTGAAGQTGQTGQAAATKIKGVGHVIAVASGKGGVGKSTVAANLASALHASGAKVGLCDCDIYGPSISLMFGATNEQPMATSENIIIPLDRYGVKLISMGSLLSDDAPAILRGPMVTRATQQFLRQVEWKGLDYLILDLPPGTGDIQLTVVQTVALSGAIIVTTPQEVALIDARKAGAMFEKVNVSVLGIIENMSYFLNPSDGTKYPIFGEGGGEREANRLKVPLLGQIPIDIATREAADRGKPIVFENPKSDISQIFMTIAKSLREKIK